ncbi:PhoX family protein [Aquimarina algicola]|uniref:Phosphatase n=1 Tax=Aquimarina algicola TaxID=2589995 RepID=A0A504JCJ6_9FLAO|nr:phosphatase [Aquimarina algicola]TPN88696.1 phosphatase [Aquimarina algicola]
MKNNLGLAFLCISSLFISCNDDDDTTTTNPPSGESIELKNHSKTPAFLKTKPGFEDLEIYSLLSSEDQLTDSPEFVYGSMGDGAGLLRNDDGTFTLINNTEADFSVARITLDETFKPTKGEYILNSGATANTAQCSGSLITPEEHGFGPLYLSAGEWGGSAKFVYGTNPFRDASAAGVQTALTALGQWQVENAVALGKDAYPGKTVVLIGDDNEGSDVSGGQLAMYVSDNVGDLNNGKLYGLKIGDGTVTDNDLAASNEPLDVEFIELEQRTYEPLQTECVDKKIMAFNRVEDIDYRKGSGANNREIYFNATGRDNVEGRTSYGRVYKLILDENDPLKGKISVILNGDDETGIAKTFRSPDNITVTENYAYIQEDPNSHTADRAHDAYLYQYDLRTNSLKTVLESAHRTQEAFDGGYASADDRLGAWELTGMIDISDIIGVDNTFILIQQAHTWKNDAFLNPDGAGTADNSSNEGSIITVVKGLPR